jgi:hypothetical protein
MEEAIVGFAGEETWASEEGARIARQSAVCMSLIHQRGSCNIRVGLRYPALDIGPQDNLCW